VLGIDVGELEHPRGRARRAAGATRSSGRVAVRGARSTPGRARGCPGTAARAPPRGAGARPRAAPRRKEVRAQAWRSAHPRSTPRGGSGRAGTWAAGRSSAPRRRPRPVPELVHGGDGSGGDGSRGAAGERVRPAWKGEEHSRGVRPGCGSRPVPVVDFCRHFSARERRSGRSFASVRPAAGCFAGGLTPMVSVS
jgi:hypothetical protein